MTELEKLQNTVRWYQSVLIVAGGYVDVPINGNHNDSKTRQALREFQDAWGMEATGFLTVASNVALTQLGLHWIYRRGLPSSLGKKTDALTALIKEFQDDYGFAVDGDVGPITMKAMTEVLTAAKPSPFVPFKRELMDRPYLGEGSEEAEALGAQGEAVGTPGVIGDDDRDIVSNTIAAPHRWMCLFNTGNEVQHLNYTGRAITKRSGDFLWSVGGSGLLISPRHILTAAHVVDNYDEKSREVTIDGTPGRYTKHFVATTVKVSPGHNGQFIVKKFREPYGTASTTKYKVSSRYNVINNSSTILDDFEDFALIELAKPIDKLAPVQVRKFLIKGKIHEDRKQLPELQYWGATAGYVIEAVETKDLQGKAVETAGYPEKGTQLGRCWRQHLAKGVIDNTLNSRNPNPSLLLYHTADTTNSQSGSPLWITVLRKGKPVRQCVGIVVQAPAKTYNMALALTDRVLKQIHAWAPKTFDYQDGRLRVN